MHFYLDLDRLTVAAPRLQNLIVVAWERPMNIREEPDIAGMLEDKLLGDLRAMLPQGPNVPLTFAAYDPGGQMIGGISGGTSYGWLLVKILWVSEECRSRGIGSALVTAIEKRAVRLGCHGAWLDTSNPAAIPLYNKLGYEVFAELANAPDREPATHRRVFMRKALG